MSKKHVCASCRFFDPYYTDDDPPPHDGTCHRYPPVWVGETGDINTLVDTGAWSLPYVAAYATCGEWRKRKEDK